MNIAYFSNQFADAEGHGLARYSRELHTALCSSSNRFKVTPVSAWSSMSRESLSSLKKASGLRVLPWGRRLTPFFWAFLNSPTIEYGIDTEVDLVHAVSLGYPVATRKPLVVTIHDLGPLTHPRYFENTSPWIMKRSLSQAINQAESIICVSNSTADELLRVVGNPVKNRIKVIHEGVSEEFFSLPSPTASLSSLKLLPEGAPYILTTGKVSPRKNVQGVIRAMSRLADTIPHHLILVGGDGWDVKEAYRVAKSSGIDDRVHFPGYVSDEQLKSLYRGASAYVHPSFYEGFGLTVLEAMASGCPVITSNIFSLPEVAGDAAILIDPSSVSDIATSILELCSDNSKASEYREKGVLRAREFEWAACAEKVADVYSSALK